MNELQALRNLYDAANRLRSTAPVDDDFPEMMHEFDGAIRAANGVVGMLPKVVCLCGSSRFYEAYQQAEYDETMAGNIYLSIGFYPHCSERDHGEGVGHDSAEKAMLDELHKRKIDLADEVFVLNVDGYIGDSTRSEVEYARATGKPIRWLEPDKAA